MPVGSLETTCHLGIESVERFSGEIAKVRDELDASMGAGQAAEQDVLVICQTEAESERPVLPSPTVLPSPARWPSRHYDDLDIP